MNKVAYELGQKVAYNMYAQAPGAPEGSPTGDALMGALLGGTAGAGAGMLSAGDEPTFNMFGAKDEYQRDLLRKALAGGLLGAGAGGMAGLGKDILK